MPVATTETRIMPSMSGSSVEPTMMLASGSTSERMRLAASSSSKSVMSGPAVMLISTPLAPLRLISSSSGLAIAFSAAWTARSSPEALAGAHHRLAHLVHHRADVGEVEVDDARTDHEVGHALDALVEHVVGQREGVGEGGLLVRQPEEVLVGDDDQRVDVLLQLLDAGLGLAHAARALELERLGHDADGQDAHLARGLGDDRRGAGSGAAAHAGGDEAHVAARELLDDVLDALLGGRRAHFGTGAGAETLGHAGAELELVVGARVLERLRVGVGHDELAALERVLDHVVDGVSASAADTDHGDPGAEVVRYRDAEIQSHVPVRLFCFASAPAPPRDPLACPMISRMYRNATTRSRDFMGITPKI